MNNKRKNEKKKKEEEGFKKKKKHVLTSKLFPRSGNCLLIGNHG
jgi:hypothetical protein